MSNRSIFLPAEYKKIADEHNTFSNDIVGVFAFSMGVAALASAVATVGLATLSFLFCSLWLGYKSLLSYRVLRRVYNGIPWWQLVVDGLLENFVFILGFGFVGSVAMELVTIQLIENVSLWEILRIGS